MNRSAALISFVVFVVLPSFAHAQNEQRVNPGAVKHFNRGKELERQAYAHKPFSKELAAEAADEYRLALMADHNYYVAHLNLCTLLKVIKDPYGAIEEY
jgi:hypothetical protein